MKFFLDTLLITLSIMVIIVLVQFVRARMLRSRPQPLYAKLYPYVPGDFDGTTLIIRFHNPQDSTVRIALTSGSGEELITHANFAAGDHAVTHNLSSTERSFDLVFETSNLKTSRKLEL